MIHKRLFRENSINNDIDNDSSNTNNTEDITVAIALVKVDDYYFFDHFLLLLLLATIFTATWSSHDIDSSLNKTNAPEPT